MPIVIDRLDMLDMLDRNSAAPTGRSSRTPFAARTIATLCIAAAAVLAVPARTQAGVDEPAPASEKVRDNMVVVLDASGSMKEPLPGDGRSKMEAAKAALLNVLANAPPDANVGVLVFSGGGGSREWVQPIGPVDIARVRSAIAPIRAAGGTPLGAYIKKAADALLDRRAQQSGYGTFRLLVVTDGEADDAKLVERYVPDVMARGITMDVIGVNMKADHTLSRRVHVYRRANDPASLGSALADVFAELGARADDTTTAESFEMIRALPDGLAATVLASITAQRDQPIGDAPAARPAAARPESPGEPSPGAGSTPAGAPPTQPPTPNTGRGWSIARWFCALAVLVLLLALKVIATMARKGAAGAKR